MPPLEGLVVDKRRSVRRAAHSTRTRSLISFIRQPDFVTPEVLPDRRAGRGEEA
ncbi:MAG: hypothetical protein ACLT98_06875 [Eggerthellaceae bacterium]